MAEMNADFQKAFKAQNHKDFIFYAKIGMAASIPLNLVCTAMDLGMYPNKASNLFYARLICVAFVFLSWFFLNKSKTVINQRIYGVGWYVFPLLMILWMIYYIKDPISPYYAGLNIVLLAVGLMSPWTYFQNLLTAFLTLLFYCLIAFDINSNDHINYIINNLTFLFLTAVIVVVVSYANFKQRLREFSLRYELDANRKSIESANQKLIEMDRVKSRFFANVSHEMRTPLTLLIGPLENLARRLGPSADAATRDILASMQNNGMRLLKLINDLLELIRLESGRLEVKREPLEVVEFINGLASAVRQMAADKGITLETTVEPELDSILGDRDKLEKILLNLLFNALKFTPTNGHIWLKAGVVDSNYYLVVQDTGIGIAEKSLPFVFDRFWQEDGSSKRKFQGVGIGLALVKELAQNMGGQVSVVSELGKGTTFTVRLPLERPTKSDFASLPAPAVGVENGQSQTEEWLVNLYRRAEFFPTSANKPASAREKIAAQNGRPVVLVADDEPDMRRFLVSQLEGYYEVVEAADGNEASEKAQSILPDVILLDLMMPHKDGMQVCQELREYAPTSTIPVIMLTARADEEIKFNALKTGVNDFLAKPFSTHELQARIRNLIESHQFQRKLTRQNAALSNAIEQIKETEMQLVQSEKLSSLGRMSAGIIHEINNPLNFSLTGLFALRGKSKKLPAEEQEDYNAIVNDVEEGLKRVRNIVSDLRTFTHPGGGTGEPVEVLDVVDAALRFLGGEWRDTVLIQKEIPEKTVMWANRNKLIHVLVNLVQNAIDAMREKSYSQGDQPRIHITAGTENVRTWVKVRDNGPGIDPGNTGKIFDPFFTTKEVGKGMGLGLSICYRIVKDYGGNISVDSRPGQFCEFTLDFPANAEAATEMEMEHGELVRL